MRNMIEVNKTAFNILISQLVDEANLTAPKGVRYFRTNAEEKDWLQQAKIIDKHQILPNLIGTLLEFEKEKYICSVGLKFSPANLDSLVLNDSEINSGLITLLIAEGIIKINSSVNYLEFFDNIMFQHQDKAYSGHDYLDIVTYLEPIQLYKIPKTSVLIHENINRIFVYIFSENPNNLILRFQSNVLNTISDISLIGSNNISYGLLISSLLSTTFKHAFLELYRLVERLFPINYLKDFHNKVSTKLSFLQFSAELENITSWRPKEEEALNKIFSITKTSTKNYFKAFLDSSVRLSGQTDYLYFYKLRNSIVHFRAGHEEFELTDHQWNLLLLATLHLVDEHYTLNVKSLA